MENKAEYSYVDYVFQQAPTDHGFNLCSAQFPFTIVLAESLQIKHQS